MSLEKANLSFKTPSPKPHLNRTGSVLALPILPFLIGIVQKVFSEKASAIARMRQKCVRNASEMGLVLLGKEGRSKMRQKCVRIASKMRQKCAEHLWGRTPFGRYRLKGKMTCGRCTSTPVSGVKAHLPRPPFWKPPFSEPPKGQGPLDLQKL